MDKCNKLIIQQPPEEVRLLNGRAWVTSEVSLTDIQKILKYLARIEDQFCFTSRALYFWYGLDEEELDKIKEGESAVIDYAEGKMVVRRESYRLFTIKNQ